MQGLHRFLHVLAHFVDARDNIRMIFVYLPNILTVLGHYTAYPHLELRHEMCRHVVNVLVWMAGRMNGNYMDKFAIVPYTIRDDKSALCDLLDRTVGNEAQFQVSGDCSHSGELRDQQVSGADKGRRVEMGSHQRRAESCPVGGGRHVHVTRPADSRYLLLSLVPLPRRVCAAVKF